ncbi:DUF3060 family protein [Frondihabitans sp. PhB188]|uniref:DUF3060 domain-containing protein n=1 Tax=Frondihabitans sp. PhB188 TaxID=2485200 RepID=UPI000F4826E5|nr:DUF3060 domain-containing protein [Frondihabitans sp. PhB188]ROQ39951.1 DUF3060 family protein [Frondihabitans sp. PhB188]
MRRRTARLSAVALLIGASAALTGCTVASEVSEPEPTGPTATQAPSAVTLKCVDDFMLIDADALKAAKKPKTVDVKCDLTSVVGTGASITLKGTTDLVVEGNRNTITVDDATTRVRLSGNENAVKYTGASKPEVDDKGAANTITAATK